jgi:putative component of toxin-antitoxin plasmid stabilization module
LVAGLKDRKAKSWIQERLREIQKDNAETQRAQRFAEKSKKKPV